jgi:TIR domain
MANQQHLDLLLQGITVWNAWREKQGPGFRPDLSEAHLNSANLDGATVGWTIFGALDLRTVKGLETLLHEGPSTIGTDTLEQSQGDLPEAFLRGAGLSETSIAYAYSLKSHPIEYCTCFISYSSKDSDFATRLHADLQQQSVRCWFAPEDLKIGEKVWYRIDESIRLYDKLLVILSQHSVDSAWVEREVMAALEKEQDYQKLVLFPITLDEQVMQSNLPWAADIRRSRHIGDFTAWKDHDTYQTAFTRLLRDLQASTSPKQEP